MSFAAWNRAILRVISGRMPFGKYHCTACHSKVLTFLPYREGLRSQPALMRALNVIGSDLQSFECPRCGSHDRERHLMFYMEACGVFDSLAGSSILHFAPETQLSSRIVRCSPSMYIKGDLTPKAPDIQRIDLLSIPYPDDSFDLVLANHVLEHVPDDKKALLEIFRVLRPGGAAILQTPYSEKLKSTWEDSGIDDDLTRLQSYGQEDHVRLYGQDIFDRFTKCGLRSDVTMHKDVLPGIDAKLEGVNPLEPFFLFRKDGFP